MKPEELTDIKRRFMRGEAITQTDILHLIWAAEEAASVPEVARLLRDAEVEFNRLTGVKA